MRKQSVNTFVVPSYDCRQNCTPARTRFVWYNPKENTIGNKSNSNKLLDTLKSFIKDSLAEFKTDIVTMIETHTERPVSLQDRESY